MRLTFLFVSLACCVGCSKENQTRGNVASTNTIIKQQKIKSSTCLFGHYTLESVKIEYGHYEDKRNTRIVSNEVPLQYYGGPVFVIGSKTNTIGCLTCGYIKDIYENEWIRSSINTDGFYFPINYYIEQFINTNSNQLIKQYINIDKTNVMNSIEFNYTNDFSSLLLKLYNQAKQNSTATLIIKNENDRNVNRAEYISDKETFRIWYNINEQMAYAVSIAQLDKLFISEHTVFGGGQN